MLPPVAIEPPFLPLPLPLPFFTPMRPLVGPDTNLQRPLANLIYFAPLRAVNTFCGILLKIKAHFYFLIACTMRLIVCLDAVL
jgi:hypothetical protein